MAALHDEIQLRFVIPFGDFADAPETPVHEKLLEGLIRRFEIYAPFKVQMAVHIAAQRILCWRLVFNEAI